MILGIDFDNTLVCYDGLFHAVALEWGLISKHTPQSKQGVRKYLREAGREDDFTRLQGYVYGPGIMSAKPFPFALECIGMLLRSGVEICIISHKTRVPILGPVHDLHRYAMDWMDSHQLFAEGMLSPAQVFLEESREAKAARIAAKGCTHFVDDLPEFFSLPQFPHNTQQLLFAPCNQGAVPDSPWLNFSSWREICQYCLKYGT